CKQRCYGSYPARDPRSDPRRCPSSEDNCIRYATCSPGGDHRFQPYWDDPFYNYRGRDAGPGVCSCEALRALYRRVGAVDPDEFGNCPFNSYHIGLMSHWEPNVEGPNIGACVFHTIREDAPGSWSDQGCSSGPTRDWYGDGDGLYAAKYAGMGWHWCGYMC